MPEAIKSESWKDRYDYYLKLQKMRTELMTKVREVMGEPGGLWFGNKYFEYLTKLNDKFGDDNVLSYISAHAFTGSTVSEDPNDGFDDSDEGNWEMYVTHMEFPGEYSVKRFYEELSNELDLMAQNK